MRSGDQLKATSSYGRSSSCPAIAMLRNVCRALLALSIGDAPLPADRFSIISLSGTSQPFVNTDSSFNLPRVLQKKLSRFAARLFLFSGIFETLGFLGQTLLKGQRMFYPKSLH